jgi:succinate dehydrogenase / fumarate reductase cytochrome b subunit
VKDTRPVNLDLTKFRFPRMAIVSILHRISGVVLFISLPILLYLLHQSLASQHSFLQIQDMLMNPLIKIVIWGILAATAFHLVAGVRHLLMDLGYFESLSASKATATLVFVLSIVLIALVGVWLW